MHGPGAEKAVHGLGNLECPAGCQTCGLVFSFSTLSSAQGRLLSDLLPSSEALVAVPYGGCMVSGHSSPGAGHRAVLLHAELLLRLENGEVASYYCNLL